MSNISSIISGHNKNLLNPNKDYKFYFALTEKCHLIEYFNDIRLLNKKSQFINACRHQSKLLI